MKHKHPGKILEKRIKRQFKSTDSFIVKSGMNSDVFHAIIKCKIAIMPAEAFMIEKATSVRAETWLKLQHEYDNSLLDYIENQE